MIVRIAIAVLSLAAAASTAGAQDLDTYHQRQKDLTALSGLFGELHHIRRTCEPRFEGDVWRDRMKKLIELEEPQESEREAMVQEFNKGYRSASARFSGCDRRARDYAAGRAAQGDALIARLTETLHEAEEDPFIASPYMIAPQTEPVVEQ